MQPAETLGGIARDILDVERLDDVDHEIGIRRTFGLYRGLRGADFSGGDFRSRPDGGRTPLGRRGRGGNAGGVRREWRSRCTRDGYACEKFASI
jgi:hypothetical protein